MSKNTQQLIEDNIGLVGRVMQDKKLYSFYSKEESEDIYQVGCLGLCKAAHAFDESKGVKFSSFAYRVIHNQIRTHYKSNQKHQDVVSTDVEVYTTDSGSATTVLDFISDEAISSNTEHLCISNSVLPIILDIIDEIIDEEKNHTRKLTYIMWKDRKFKANVGSDIAKELGVTRAITCRNINMFKDALEKKLKRIGCM